ncbi:unnamed protein product [Phytophthora lilii]|uniref:Unnamed protein product n=1 Tax=Phytophthora lilii TaxID=2077276 RepID=A0A9W6T9T9_9STRA|nr:unnamed protein product [Phytophthora lilii]
MDIRSIRRFVLQCFFINVCVSLHFNLIDYNQAISTESLDACCSVVGALALVKPLLPQLIAEGSIQCMVGMLRYAKQELIIRNEDSFVQLVMTCFFGLGNIVSAPTLIQIMGPAAITSADEVIYGQVIYSQLLDVGADDAVIGCLEQSLRVKKSPPLLVDSGCRLLQAILAFPITLTSEAESRWIAVATSILQRSSTNPRTRELLFATTLMFLSRCNRSVEPARGQHIKMMKVILECLDSSIQHERSCTLLQAECTGAIRVLEEIAKSSDNLSDVLVSKCLGVLGKLIGIYMLSSSTTAQENLAYFDSAVALFATTDYVNRLISRLERCMTKEGRAEPAKLVDTAEDFKALKTLLFSAQAKKTIDAYHRLFSYLAAMVDNVGANVQTLGEYGPFFLELGCLTSQLLPTAQREEVINTALCQYAEDTAWHSMRWIAALADRGSSEFTLIVEFVLLRIVSGYTILEPALLMELLDALNYLLRCNQCREIVLASSHARELQYVLWQLVRTDVANMESESDGYDIAVSLLGITSVLLSSFSEELFSIHTEERGSDILVRFCLGALDSFLSDASAGLTKLALLEEVFQTTSIILQHCIRIGADHVRSIIQHRATQHVVNLSVVTNSKSCQLWYLEVLGVTIQSHGLLYAEKLLLLSSDPYMLLISLVRRVVQDRTATTWDFLIDCLGIVTGTMDTSGRRSDCNVLFVRLQQQSKRLVNGQTTVANARRVRKHITDTSAQLQLKYGQLIADSSAGDIGNCLKEISESGLAFYELFNAAPSFNAIEYSMIISLHLKIAQLACLKTDTERTIVEESAGCIRQLLAPICILDDAMADYINLAVTVYLSPSTRAAAWLFIDASTSVLSKAMHRLTTGVARPQCLEKSIANCFASLQAVYNARWESGEVDSALELLKICSIDKWSQDLLLESLLVLPQGLLHLFKLARAAPSNSIYRVTMNFLFQHVSEIRHKTQRVGELELSAILSVINRNPAGKVGDVCQRKWGQVPGSEMLRSALETLKLFARRKNCAVLSADLGGIDTLYNVLCAPSQYEDNTHLALEISCYLAGYGANTAHESLIFVFELLFSFVENSANYPRSRLAFLVLEFFLAVDPSLLNMSLVQQCRTQIVPSSTRSYEESKMFVQQLYIVRQKLVPPASRLNIFTDSDISDKTSQLHVPLRESEILDIIISQCRRIVQVTNDVNLCTYVDVNTSEKSTVEPQSYSQLKEAISQLSFVLDDPDMVANERFFTQYLSRFCNNVSAECRTSVETRLDLLEVLIPLLFEVLQNWKTDFGIVDQSISSVHYLTERICNVQLHFFRRNDTLAYLNAAALPYISHCPTSWNWIKATLAIVSQFDMMTPESVQAAANTTIAIIRMFMSHSFMVKKALMLISLIYREKALLALPHLLESDGITMLLTTLKLHANEPSIARNSLMLLVSLSFQRDTSRKTMDQLLAAASTVPILLVCKKYPNDAQVCEICVKLIHQMVQLFNNISNKKDQLSVVPGSTARKKSELLANLLEADIISFLFDLLDSYSSRGNNRLLEELLALLKTLTKDEHLRESAEVLHGLQELQQVINRIWENAFDSNLIEMAIDCFVNLACSDQAIGHGWRELPMWLLELAGSIHKLGAGTNGMCVEKLIGILGRLAIDSAISKAISPKGSFIILQLLLRVKEDRLLEQAIYGLLCTLCESVACAQVLIVYDTISTIAERITCHMDDEDTLLSSLCFFDVLVLNIGESYPALQDECIIEALNLVIQEYPESTGSQIYRIAITTLEKVTALDFRSVRIRPAHVKTTNSLTPQLQIPDAEKPFHDLLTQGAKFRVLWEARPDTVESIQVKLAPGGDYLLFRRKTANSLPRIERVFASQLEVCPQRSLSDECKASGSPSSPSNRILAQSLLREKFDGDRVLRLKIRDEDVLVKASSTRERIYWDLALQWLVSRRQAQPYSNATIWTREIARNLAGHLSRVSKAHSCVDTKSPKSTRLPQFHRSYAQKRCPTSPIKARPPFMTISQNHHINNDHELDFRGLGASSAREETDNAFLSNHNLQMDVKQTPAHQILSETSLNSEIANSGGGANQEVVDRPARIPAVKPPARHQIGNGNGGVSDMNTYDAPLALHQGHRFSHDYYKRQEQRKIWQENQVWEKDEKWTQEFLKNQEKRRSALQQELRRAQISPQAVLRSKPLKSLHPQLFKTAHLHATSDPEFDASCSPTKADVAGALSARKSARRGSKGHVHLRSRDNNSDTTPQQASAANHRRIMELRKTKPSSDTVKTPSTTIAASNSVDQVTNCEQTAFIPDNDIVTVRFTFSRGRSRGADLSPDNIEQTPQLDSLEVDGGERDKMSLSGAFSPGVELESALNAVAVNDSDLPDRPERDQAPVCIIQNNEELTNSQQSEVEMDPACADNFDRGLSDDTLVVDKDLPPDDRQFQVSNEQLRETATDENADISENNVDTTFLVNLQQGNGSVSAENEEAEVGVQATEPSIESEEREPSPSVKDQTVSPDEDGDEEAYDGDNFDDEPLPSARSAQDHTEVADKHEASGYASEFEDEAGGVTLNAPPDAASTNNQDQDANDEDEDASYSHDDFERASVSSVTSSGRRRKDQSLLDVAESLGQRTPERSEFGDEGVPARSRQLDFGSVDGDEGEQEQVQQQEADNADTEQEAAADEQTDNADGGQEAAAEETPAWGVEH